MKTWRCDRCGNVVRKGLLRSLGGAPTECEVCGNADLDDPYVEGTAHRALDRLLGRGT